MHPMFDPERRCTPVEEWPDTDRAAWKRALQPFDPLEPETGFANRWAPATRRTTELGYGRWLGWLDRAGFLDASARPGDRATRARVGAYLEMLKAFEYAPFTIAGRIQQFGNALRAMEPERDWGWILRAAARMKEQAHPVTDLNDRLQPPEEVLQLGLDLMEEAESASALDLWKRAVMYRDGLAVAGLIYRPLRISNFAGIVIGRHLVRQGQGWRLLFTAAEMKARRPFECAWPDELVTPLERYIGVHRNELLGEITDPIANKSLWVSKTGAAMTRSVLGYRITKRTKDKFGPGINPHAFRHIVATTIAIDDPENVTSVPSVLGHATLETSERHYNRARGLEAGARYQAGIGALRLRASKLRA